MRNPSNNKQKGEHNAEQNSTRDKGQRRMYNHGQHDEGANEMKLVWNEQILRRF